MRVLAQNAISKVPALALGVCADKQDRVPGLPLSLWPDLARLRRLGDFSGKLGDVQVLYPGKGPRRLLVCGLGESKSLTLERVRQAVGRAVTRAQALKLPELAVWVESFALGLDPAGAAKAISLAGALAAYRFLEFKPARTVEDKIVPLRLTLISRHRAQVSPAAREGEVLANAANYVRTLGNRPANELYPQALAREARALARAYPPRLSVKVLDQARLRQGKYLALLAVGSGSSHPPVLLEMRYRGGRAGDAPIVLVGKGITFDSGGLCLKPSAKMDEMKFDMAGGAAVLGILRAAAELRLPVNLVGVVPAAENLPSGTACRPGDIVTSRSGQTIEVVNTDAEGRVILADGLNHALGLKPACIVDLATLTGAVIVALGHAATGLLSNNPRLAADLKAAGEASGERVWELPLWEDYRELLASDIADIANVASKPGAGTILGGIFLEKFVGKTPWVHLDIAGTAYTDGTAIFVKGATGVGVRLVIEWLKGRVARKGK